eukprot:CAMPEP_0180639536 /NCGR_PEP_ID=MMETSP1037_2-20121125/45081_1 /TAXON_ID=632150 /ORGANISM="Azadinium spinosum, Strain 3D9" /LENGTH=49 /DNA_ID= /DNA_START= /DNA_END= /DNA_ORIENTATION=
MGEVRHVAPTLTAGHLASFGLCRVEPELHRLKAHGKQNILGLMVIYLPP